MRDYKRGDIVATLEGTFLVSEVIEAINPFTFMAEPCVMVYWYGTERKIPYNRIIG